MKIKIKNTCGEIIWEGQSSSVKEAIKMASSSGADLSEANLDGIKSDFLEIIKELKPEIPYLYKALIDGKIDGSTYEGECACLVGTLANAKDERFDNLCVKPDSSRPAERFFLAIGKGDTPENNKVSAIVKEWIIEFCDENAINLPTRKILWSDQNA